MADKDELKDRDDDLPILADDQDNQDDDANASDDAEREDEFGDDELADHEKHVLELLSDEELAALNGDDDDPGDDPDQVEDETQAAAAPQPDPEPKPEPAPAPAAVQEQSTAPVELTAEQIEFINTKAKEERQEAMDKWRDGDMTDDELQAALDQVDQAKEEARQAALEQAAEEREAAAFEERKAAFHSAAREYLTKDYPELAAKEHMAEYDRHVRHVTGSPRFAGLSDREMLEAAHKLYVAEAAALGFDAPPLKGVDNPAPKPKSKVETRAKMHVPKPDVVPTLARVPSAAANSTVENKWTALQQQFNRADAAGREKIMNNLSDEDAEYFASLDVDA
ncbi:hypothetical protein [Roseinatronobacter sp. NSM]|uniref:hypothetical protein n=1 Tax=Roseinatronobacter sp. NSM TaxID=3457785 RepID=UPI0040361090